MKQFFDFTEIFKEGFIELRGRSNLLAEGYGSILVYSPQEIRLASENGNLAILGENLTLRHLSREKVAVEGRIDKIEFI